MHLSSHIACHARIDVGLSLNLYNYSHSINLTCMIGHYRIPKPEESERSEKRRAYLSRWLLWPIIIINRPS